MRGVDTVHTKDREKQQMQEKVGAAVLPITRNPLVDGLVLKGLVLLGGGQDNDIPHGLGRPLAGWHPVRIYDVTEGPVAYYETNAGQTITNATPYIRINYEDLVKDTHGAVTVGAAWVFTAPVAGFYRVTASTLPQFGGAAPANNAYQVELWASKNGAIHKMLDRASADLWGAHGLSGSAEVELAKGDTLAIDMYQDSGADRTLYNDARHNHVEISRVTEGPPLWDAQGELDLSMQSKVLRLRSQFNQTVDLYVH